MPSSKALKKSTSWETTHAFTCCLFLFFESRMLLLNSVATHLYLDFAVFVMPRRVANAKLLFIFGIALEQIVVRHRFGH